MGDFLLQCDRGSEFNELRGCVYVEAGGGKRGECSVHLRDVSAQSSAPLEPLQLPLYSFCAPFLSAKRK